MNIVDEYYNVHGMIEDDPRPSYMDYYPSFTMEEWYYDANNINDSANNDIENNENNDNNEENNDSEE
ncbi:hypothetical protein PV325_011370 [Microctonus aethiopoides]|nr:hypothetical protein PV325_011370 [Microctonus aethiopoides]